MSELNFQEQFSEIVKNGKSYDVALEFLKSLDGKERKKLAIYAKKEFAFVWEHIIEESNNGLNFKYISKGSDLQKGMLTALSFLTDNFKKFNDGSSKGSYATYTFLKQILPLYCPEWFSQFINLRIGDNWFSHALEYHELVALEKQNYCVLEPETVVAHITKVVYEHKDNKSYYTSSQLLKDNISLEKHVWYLFEYPSDIHWADQYRNIENVDIEHCWRAAFLEFSESGKLDRQRLLQEAILASNRNFNKPNSGWFSDLLLHLMPTDSELIQLQSDLFSIFNSPHSKGINTSLKLLKRIVSLKVFDADGFLENSTLLLASDVKSVVSSTLMIYDKIIRTNKSKFQEVCILSCQTFIHQENDLQLRAAKLIHKYGNSEDESISEELSPFETNILSEPKVLIQAFLLNPESEEEELSEMFTHESPTIDAFTPVLVPQSFDDFVFQASQAFDNNSPLSFDLFIAGLLLHQDQLKGEKLAKLEPAVQRAFKLRFGDRRSSTGHLDLMLVNFFMDFIFDLCEKEIKGINYFDAIIDQYDRDHITNLKTLQYWHSGESSPAYYAFKNLLLYVHEKLDNEDQLPLLSTPSHEPCWIDPKVLAQRLSLYQKANVAPSSIDLEIAISRCYLYKNEGRKESDALLEGEMRNLINFLCSSKLKPTTSFNYPTAWHTAWIVKGMMEVDPELSELSPFRIHPDHLRGDHSWEIITEKYRDQDWSMEKNSFVTVYKDRTLLKMTSVDRLLPKSSKKFLGIFDFGGAKKAEVVYSLYADQIIKERWFDYQENDIQRMMSITPNNPGQLLMNLAAKIFKMPSFLGETDKRIIANTLSYLAEIEQPKGKVMNQFLGLCLILADKLSRNMALEIWIQRINDPNLDNVTIGKIIAKTCYMEFAPLKRLTDALSSVIHISGEHKEHTNQLILACIREMPDVPVRNLKKLLLLFKETLPKNPVFKEDIQLMGKLDVWKKTNSLKPIISTLLK